MTTAKCANLMFQTQSFRCRYCPHKSPLPQTLADIGLAVNRTTFVSGRLVFFKKIDYTSTRLLVRVVSWPIGMSDLVDELVSQTISLPSDVTSAVEYSSYSLSLLIVESLRRHNSPPDSSVMYFIFCCPDTLVCGLTQSMYLCFGLAHRLILPGVTISRVFLPTYYWFCLFTCPNHLSPQSRFPEPVCDIIYLHYLPHILISQMVSCVAACPPTLY